MPLVIPILDQFAANKLDMKKRPQNPKTAILQNRYVIGSLAAGLMLSLAYHFIKWLLF